MDNLKVDITDLLIVFDELLVPPTEEELGVYWFGIKRTDGIEVTLSFSIYERYVTVLLSKPGTAISTTRLKNCSEIRILDQEKKCLEILHSNGKGRCFLALIGASVLEYTE